VLTYCVDHYIFCIKLDSPRYGLIGAFYTNKPIKAGEDILSDYGYALKNFKGDECDEGREWYKEEIKKMSKKLEHAIA
jgi:SET domain-containing protein